MEIDKQILVALHSIDRNLKRIADCMEREAKAERTIRRIINMSENNTKEETENE